jgi:drug/metabolite transporter (DMT)-like permease
MINLLPSFLTTICFSISATCGARTARMMGGVEANFWRLTFATLFLSLWAWSFGKGLGGSAFPLFFISGLIGIGFGDVALFQTLPRLGSRLTIVLVQCLSAPFGALIEWVWLGTKLSTLQMICGSVILGGIAISLAPIDNSNLKRHEWIPGLLFGISAAFGNALGAVLSRKAYALCNEQGEVIDGGTAAYQRILGGLLVAGICLLAVKWRSVKGHLTHSGEYPNLPPAEKWRKVLPWVLANSLAGQTLGVTCYQWAFQTTPTGIVLPIVATTPLVAIPIAWLIDGEKPTKRSILGGLIAVAGVIGLTTLKNH